MSQDRECGHGVHRYRLRDFGRQALSKEGNSAFGFTATGTIIDLMVEELLDVVDGEEMFTVH